MKYRKLGNSDLEVSVVGLGTWVTGGGQVWGTDPDDNESVRAIRASLDHGVSLIDTAPAYGFGRSEEVVGRAIRGRRDKVILATKCGLWWQDSRGSLFVEDFDGKTLYRRACDGWEPTTSISIRCTGPPSNRIRHPLKRPWAA